MCFGKQTPMMGGAPELDPTLPLKSLGSNPAPPSAPGTNPLKVMSPVSNPGVMSTLSPITNSAVQSMLTPLFMRLFGKS